MANESRNIIKPTIALQPSVEQSFEIQSHNLDPQDISDDDDNNSDAGAVPDDQMDLNSNGYKPAKVLLNHFLLYFLFLRVQLPIVAK